MKRLCTLILTILMLMTFGACGIGGTAETEPSGPVELWIVTEQTPVDGFTLQIQNMIEQFELEHEDVTIRLDILPTEAEERAVYLESIRTEILTGGGPDGYLLPASNLLTLDKPQKYTYIRVERLFYDVELGMRNGMFADIREYYDADDELNTNGLVTAVMDAGVVDGARYVLPLTYDIPVLIADTERLESSGMDIDRILNGTILELMEVAIESGDKFWACGAEPASMGTDKSLRYFSQLIDYDKGEVALTAEEAAAFLRTYQALEALVAGEYLHRGSMDGTSYILEDMHPGSSPFVIYQKGLKGTLDSVAVAKAAEREITMVPIRTTSGNVVADVGYYAAVGSGCDQVGLCYEFLRMFLTEESQWNESGIPDGWPVRAKGAAEKLWSYQRMKYTGEWADEAGQRPRRRRLLEVKLSDADMPILDADIDRARFRLQLEWDSHLTIDLNDEFGNPTDADIGQIAQDLIQNLQWHLAEG